jgi:DNA-binding FadR family transcriptional regulator
MSSTDPSDETLPNLGQGSLRDRVVDLLERRILDGSFSGDRLPTEAELGQKLGVSRTVIRDAVRILEARGLLEIRQGAGTRIRASTIDVYVESAAMLLIRSDLTVGDLLDAREALETDLCVIALRNRTPENLARMARTLDSLTAAVERRDPAEAARAHVAFHTELMRATCLPALDILIRPLQQMMMATSLVPGGIASDDPAGWRVETHRALFTAVENQSLDELAAANAEHWTYTRGPAFDEVRKLRVADQYASPAQLVNSMKLDPME